MKKKPVKVGAKTSLTTPKRVSSRVPDVVPRFHAPELPDVLKLFRVHPSRPISEQIKNTVLDLIAKGIFTEGTRLPSNEQIGLQLGVAPGTVFRALSDLAKDGVIVAKMRSGYIVGPRAALFARLGVQALSNGIFACRRIGMDRDDIVRAFNRALLDHVALIKREKKDRVKPISTTKKPKRKA